MQHMQAANTHSVVVVVVVRPTRANRLETGSSTNRLAAAAAVATPCHPTPGHCTCYILPIATSADAASQCNAIQSKATPTCMCNSPHGMPQTHPTTLMMSKAKTTTQQQSSKNHQSSKKHQHTHRHVAHAPCSEAHEAPMQGIHASTIEKDSCSTLCSKARAACLLLPACCMAAAASEKVFLHVENMHMHAYVKKKNLSHARSVFACSLAAPK